MLVLKQTGSSPAIRHPIRPLELRQYRYFVVLAEELHFARAAERIGIGQSNLSREVKALEQQMGLRLFYRTSRRTKLTAVGERFVEAARRVLAAEEHARLAVGELRRSTKEQLRLGVCERVASARISTVLAAWRGANPAVELRVVSRSGRELIEEIENGLLDAGITAMQVTEPSILVEPLWTDPWLVALPSAHVLAPARAIELAELAREPIALLALDAGGALERRVVECLGSVDPRAAISERPSNVAALLMWVEAGCGVGLLSASQAQVLACTSAAIKPLRRGLPSAEVRLLRGDAPASSPLSRLIESLRANSA